ncbi:acetate kinase [Aquitalea sp. S1-19]|uniref:Acetate kinase n=1 Tax=Craterilacuibacter sinensis TaxID=2686017 RepID=A0A845C0M0_9NEIS|nr:acetate kinase [Craterilacuibacter sinensis]MCP9759538.1 acetate kinase [Aquitalea sp. S1-19]MXR38263.1 acetate/propionate family kinase [Craterilacuibacter sinensis]
MSQSLILVINCGSSSLKFGLFPVGAEEPTLSGLAECLGDADSRVVFKADGKKSTLAIAGGAHDQALEAVIEHIRARGELDSVVAVGHRVVHGGERFHASALITPEVETAIEACAALAPLHNPANLLGIRVVRACLPALPQVAVFDTAFHQTMPRAAYLYALPMKLYRDHGVRRYGFHGTSHRFVAEAAVAELGLDAADHGIVIAHLGNGASAAAIKNGASVDTTMGMTPLEGLVMGTRSGDVDPGSLAYIGEKLGLDLAGIDKLLNKESGLLGLSELSNDCRTLEEAAAEGHEGSIVALEVFAHRLARHIGGLATSLDRLDAVVFTGGIGENSDKLRAMTLAKLSAFGIEVDAEANARCTRGTAGVISRGNGPKAMVINTNEEFVIACDTAELAGITG